MAFTGRGTFRCTAFFVIFILLFLPLPGNAQLVYRDKDTRPAGTDGTIDPRWDCVVCTFVVGLVSQIKQLHNVSSNEALRKLCNFFSETDSVFCGIAGLFLFKEISVLIDQNETADTACQAVGYCKNTKCHLFPPGCGRTSLASLRSGHQLNNVMLANVCGFVPRLCQADKDVLPQVDMDGDFFSTEPTSRGTDWRGRDCDDKDPTVFPGRDSSDAVRDENCNGIYGVNQATGKPYEEMWCKDSKSMGVIVIGDSSAAHFGIPPDWVTVRQFSKAAFRNFANIIQNEMDWPMLSATTGFSNASYYAPNVDGPMVSFYTKLLKRNRCNHRDYQNVGVNGATTGRLSQLLDSISRDRTQSVKPTFLFLSMIGNDVCFPLSEGGTTPRNYYEHLTAALEKAEALLPSGSQVIIFPVSDGRVLYNVMHNRTHPVGSLNNDVTYAGFYDFLNCVGVSPCPGWLNTNETLRNLTWKNAQSLNAQIPRIINESKKFKNIRVHALGDIAAGAISTFDGPVWELIELVDGFHPSQLGSAILGQYIFNQTVKLGIVPPANQFNDLIIERFGEGVY